MEIAKTVATRSTCLRHNVGAVIVREKRIVSTGYNGAPGGLPHCLDIGCIRDQEGIPSGTMVERCVGVHAEQNAIIQAALHGVSTEGTTIYITHQPCIICAKMVINAGIDRVVYEIDYPDNSGVELLESAGVSTKKFIYNER
jgi:dCMP deaminase